MCFSAKQSKRALTFGILCGLALMFFGDEQHKKVNRILGIFFIYVSLMQFVEYLIWTDLDCKNGNNKLAGKIGFLLNYLQPTMAFILVMLFKNNHGNEDYIPIALNIFYLMYITRQYYYYLKRSDICSKVVDKHLAWAWRDYYDYLLFSIVLIFNILYYMQCCSAVLALAISYFYFFLSMTEFHEHMGELWCYMVTNVPLIILLYQKFA
jgi:hypothetical protein